LARQKNAAISAIRESVNALLTIEMADFCGLPQVSARFLCQDSLFHFNEKTALQAALDSHRKVFPGANPPRGQERTEALSARLGLRVPD
jgi:hypothetical protein